MTSSICTRVGTARRLARRGTGPWRASRPRHCRPGRDRAECACSGVASICVTIASVGWSASISTTLPRWVMTSPTVWSPRSSTERSIAFSAGAASPAWPSPCSSMAPRSSSLCSSASCVRSVRTLSRPRKKREIAGDAARHRAQDRQRDHDRRRQDQRHAVGAQQRPGLGHDLGEDHDQHADDERGVDDARRAEQRRQHRRRERGREDVDHVVAEQDGAHRLVLAVEQRVHDRRALVALLGEPVHARPRGAGDRRLGRRQVGRQQQAEQHQRDRRRRAGRRD